MFYLENSCPVCTDGILGFIKCSDNKTITIMCDECNSVWMRPEETESGAPVFPQPPGFELLDEDISISREDSDWATYDEIVSEELEDFVSHDREYNQHPPWKKIRIMQKST